MKKTIKFLGLGLIALTGLFVNANFASAQTATISTCSSATLSGTVSDTNGISTAAWFEYGTNFSNVSNGAGSRTTTQYFTVSGSAVSQVITGLSESTTYYYRLAGSNANGSGHGGTLSFTTPSCNNNNNPGTSLPSVTTNSANILSQNSATLNGYVVANGSSVNAWFEFGTTQSLGNTTNSVSYGNTSTSFSSTYYNFAQNTTYYYRAVAQNSQGTVYGSILSFTTSGNNNCYYNNCNNTVVSVSTRSADVSGTYASLNGYVDPNYTSDTTRWFEWGTTQSLGNVTPMLSQGTVASMYSAPVTNLIYNTTYYYRAVARNSQGTVYGNILSFTTSNNGYNNTGYAPTVTTLLATELTGSTARLNGLVFAANGQSSNAWFEWGTNASLGNKTQTVGVGALPTVKHSDYISGLTVGQTYYYRIVAENSYGKEYGTVNTFVAQASTQTVVTSQPTVVYKPVTTVVTQGGVTQSLVMLSIEGGADMIVSGEKRTYHVAWKNISGQTLSNVVLRVSFPKSMNVDSATKGVYSAADNSVVLDLKTLDPSESGETFIFTTADTLKAGETLVPTANMVFTAKNGVQGDAIAYVTHTAQVAQNGLGASVFGSGDFAPTTLLGWVSLLVLVLIVAFLGTHLYGKLND